MIRCQGQWLEGPMNRNIFRLKIISRQMEVVYFWPKKNRDTGYPQVTSVGLATVALMHAYRSRAGGLILGGLFGTGKFPAITTAATVFSASSLRNMQAIRIIPAIASRTSSTVVQHYQLL